MLINILFYKAELASSMGKQNNSQKKDIFEKLHYVKKKILEHYLILSLFER